jgi:DNA-directed RNA polymerase specialized sigma subunit
MKNWSDEGFAGYMAAMIDGEGHIEIISDYSVRIRIANTVEHTLHAMSTRLNLGKVYEYTRPQGKNFKRLFCLEISNCHDVKSVFDLCGGYIHKKKDQMDAAIKVVDRVLSEAGKLDDRNRAILAFINQGLKQKEIASRFGISQQLVSRIKSGHTWASNKIRHLGRLQKRKFPRGMDQSFRLHGSPK